MKTIKNNCPISTVKGAKISGRKVNTWAEVAGLGVTDTIGTTTERIHNSCLSNRSATGINKLNYKEYCKSEMERTPPSKIS